MQTEHALLQPEDAAKRLGLSASTLAKMRLSGNGPQYVKISSRVLYRPADIDAFVAERVRSSTSDSPTAA